MALPATLTVEPIAGTPVNLEKVNQDNNGVTYFARQSDGSELKLVIKRTLQGKKLGAQTERHSLDLTYTTFDPDGIPVVAQSYQHILSPRGKPVDQAKQMAIGLADVVTGQITPLLNWEV